MWRSRASKSKTLTSEESTRDVTGRGTSPSQFIKKGDDPSSDGDFRPDVDQCESCEQVDLLLTHDMLVLVSLDERCFVRRGLRNEI